MSDRRFDQSAVGLEIDAALEAGLRAGLRRSIVPPATPVQVREAIETMAANRGARTAPRLAWRGVSALAGLAAAALIVAIIGVSLSLRGSAPAAPTPRPTPGTPGPVLPDPTGGETPATSFQWTGAGLTAFASTGDGRIRFTEDGGVTWSEPITLPQTSGQSTETSLDFVDRTHGWQVSTVLQSGVWHIRVQRTTDGGLTWISSEAASFADQANLGLFTSTHFADAGHGVVFITRSVETPGAGDSRGVTTYQGCVEYVTDDDGASWTGPKSSVCLPGSVTWASRQAGVAIQESRTAVASTLDGGLTWKTSALPGIPSGDVYWSLTPSVGGRGDLSILTMLVPAGGSWSTAPVVRYRGEDGGATWVEEFRSTTPDESGLGNWTSVLAPDYYLTLHQIPSTGRTNKDDFLRSSDGGRTWDEVSTSGFSVATYMDWADELHGRLDGINDCGVGETCQSVGTTSGGIFLTDDGGKTWHQLAFPKS